MDIKIRSALQKDIKGIVALLKSLEGVWQKDWRDDCVSIAVKSAGDLAVVAVLDDSVIGFASFHDTGFRAYLSEMEIAEKYQFTGLGTKILKYAENLLKEKSCSLIVADAYPPAEGFYKKNGWERSGSTLIAKWV